MSDWFWLFLIYSFLGFCLEKIFARAVRSPRQVRKCFLVLPLCPVYGLSMCAVAALIRPDFPFWVQAVLGGVVCTGVEYLVHFYYDRVFRTRFWDYSDLSVHLNGRVSPYFSAVWGVLSALAVRYLQPSAEALVSVIPVGVTFGVWMLLALDAVLTSSLLLRYHDTEQLSLSALFRQE